MSPYLFILNTHCGVTFSLSQSFEWTGSQSAFDVAAKNTSSSAILDTDRLLFVNSAESAHRTLMTSSVRTSRKSVRSPLQNCFFGFFSVDQATASTKLWWTTTVTAKPKTSRQKQKHHGKIKNLTTKTKYLTAKSEKQNTSRQNQKPHGKPKYFTAKTKQLWFWRGYLLSQYQETHSTVNEEKKGDVLTPVL